MEELQKVKALLFARHEARHLAEYPHAMDYKISTLKKYCSSNNIQVLASYEAVGPTEMFEQSFIADIRRHKRAFTSEASILVVVQWDDLCYWMRREYITNELKKLNLTVKTIIDYEKSSSVWE